MPYVGTGLVSNFASTFRDNFTGDGSATSFTLSRNAHHENDLEVFIGNVRQQPGSAYTVSGTTLAFTGTPANGEVIYVVHQAGALQTVQAPTDHGARDFNITGDANKITFGDDSEITVTHVADSGLALKNTNTGDDKPFTLVLQTGETDMAANDVIGAINFQAPDEGTGTDAILVAAGIAAVSEGDFSSSSNATKLSFKTAASAAAAETMSLSSGGNLTVSGNVSVGGDLDVTGSFDMSDANITNVGSIALDSISGDADSNTSITFSGSDVITFATGGSTSFTANANQTVTFSAAVSGTSADFDGGVTIDNFTIDGTEIDLSSGDLTVDVAGDIILDADGGEVLFHDATTAIGHVSMASSNLTIKSLVSDAAIIFQGNDGGAGITALTLDMSASGAASFNSSVTLGGGLIIPDGGDIGSASDLNAIGISSGGVVSITATTASTNSTTGALTVGGGAGIAADLSVGDDLRLISDSAVLSFGADGDVTLTHAADTSLTLNVMMAATTFEPSGDTAAGDNAAIGFTSAEGLILTGQGSTSDITLKNDADATVFTVPTGTDDILFPDNAKAMFGAGSDLQIFHNGSNSIIRDNGTGALDLQVSNFAIVNLASDEFLAKGTADGAFELYHNGAKQLETTAAGVTVSADLAVGDDIGLTSDSAQITFGADSEVILAHTADTGLTLQGSGLNTNFSLLAFHTTNGTVPDLRIGKSSSNTVGTFAETADGEALGQIRFTGQDSNNATREGMTIAVTQDGSSGGTTVPAKLTFTNSGGERLRLMANGRLENQSPSNSGNVLQDFRIDFRNENSAGIMAGIGCVRTNNANAPGAFVIRTSTNVDSSSNSGDGEISEKFRVAANGDLTATDTSISSNSDSRLKENISDFSYNLTKFKALKTKTFDWKQPELHGNKSSQRGFVAQDIETVDDYWIEEIEVPADSDDFQYLEDKDILYTENATIPDGKKVGDLEYKARFAKTSKLGQKDAMYVSIIQQLITKIETLESDVKTLKGE